MTNLTRVVAAVVDTKKATLYRADGTTVEILQGDSRLRSILEHITPLLASQGWAEIDLSTSNAWREFEDKSNGAVRLFRIAKSKLAGLFGAKKTEEAGLYLPGVIGEVPKGIATAAKNMAAVNEILKYATPVKADNFNEDKVAPQRPTAEANGHTPSDKTNNGSEHHFDKHEDTIIAVTAKGNIVPGVERIKSQFAGAVKNGNIKGMERFLDRIGKVIQERKHTVEDLLRFMERGDLPVADDGSIVIYKKLFRKGKDTYVDPHTRKVKQKVGSYVHMDVSMVDPNRRNECSNGLHVARRGYVGSFSGDVICLAKVRPEDVIAVPDYDANKMRVCGYHIIAELTREQYQAINTNRTLSHAAGGEELLAKAISGDHVGILQHVKITQAKGGGLIITELMEERIEAVAEEVKAESSEPAEDLGETNKAAAKAPVQRKAVSKRTKKAKRKAAVKKAKATPLPMAAKPLEAASGAPSDVPVDVNALQKLKDGRTENLDTAAKPAVTQTEVVKAMWDAALAGDRKQAQELLDFKKKAKKGWTVWDLPATAGDTLKALLVV